MSSLPFFLWRGRGKFLQREENTGNRSIRNGWNSRPTDTSLVYGVRFPLRESVPFVFRRQSN